MTGTLVVVVGVSYCFCTCNRLHTETDCLTLYASSR